MVMCSKHRFAGMCAWMLGSFALIACGAGPGAGNGPPIEIGLISTLTGAQAQYGAQALAGINLALQEKGRTVGGRSIDLIKVEEGCTPEGGANAASQLVGRVVAILGPSCSGSMAAAGPILRKARIPHLTAAYLPEITERRDNDYVFRQVANDRQVVTALARDLESDKTLTSSIALAHDTTTYGAGAADVLVQTLKKDNLPAPVTTVSFDYGATNFSGQLAKIQASNVKAIALTAYETESGLFTKQARQLGLDMPIYCSVAGFKEFRDPAGSAADGVHFTARFLAIDQATRTFTDKFMAANQFEPTDSASGAYLATLALIDALNRVGPDAGGSKLRDAIRATNLKTSVGLAAWDAKGDLKSPVILVGVNKGSTPVILQRQTIISP